MRAIHVVRPFVTLLAMALLVECSGSGGSSGAGAKSVIPSSNGIHRLRAMSMGGCSPCNVYPDGTLAYWDDASGNIYLYDGPITSSSTPSATLSPSWGYLNGGMTFDTSGNLWVTYSTGSAGTIVEYAAPITTGESPSVTISGSNTGLIASVGISYNQSTGNIYVADEYAHSVSAWSATASGNVAPSTTMTNSNIGYAGLKTDANYIYVSSAAGGVAQFNLTASGSSSPVATFATGVHSYWLDFDVEGNVYLGGQGSVCRYLYDDSWNDFVCFTSGTATNIAVDDAGYVYTTSATGGGTLYITPYSGGSPTVTLTGIGRGATAMALYSPGKFNGTEPQ